MSYEKEKQLVDSLAEKTASGKLKWEEGGLGDAQATIGQYTISIEEGRSPSGSTLIYIAMYDVEAKKIDSFHDEQLDSPAGPNIYFKVMKDLLARARKQATGADEALDSVLKNINEL